MAQYLIILSLSFIFLSTLYFIAEKSGLKNDLKKTSKFKTIDGLRGLAAILVVFHHSILANINAISGNWNFSNEKFISGNEHLQSFYHNAGPVGVILFFMITGFLFSNKLITSKGNISYTDFYKKRILRIAPLYYFSVLVIFIISMSMPINTPSDFLDGVKKFFGWLSFYFIGYEGFTTNYPYSRLNAGVFWTLAVEWKFYFLIPFLGLFAGSLRNVIIFSTSAALTIITLNNAGLIINTDSAITLSFLFGSLSSIIQNSQLNLKLLTLKPLSILTIACITYALLSPPEVYNNLTVTVIGVAFIIISGGNSILGLLTSKPLKATGVISYSIYLLHGIILNVCNFFLAKNISYHSITAISLIIIPLICTATYLYIEKPFISKN